MSRWAALKGISFDKAPVSPDCPELYAYGRSPPPRAPQTSGETTSDREKALFEGCLDGSREAEGMCTSLSRLTVSLFTAGAGADPAPRKRQLPTPYTSILGVL